MQIFLFHIITTFEKTDYADKVGVIPHSCDDIDISFVLPGNIGSNVHSSAGNTQIEVKGVKSIDHKAVQNPSSKSTFEATAFNNQDYLVLSVQ